MILNNIDEDFHIVIRDIHQGFYTKRPDWKSPSEGRESNFLHVIYSGKREYYVSDKTITLYEGDVYLIADKTRYKTKALINNNRECGGISIIFDMYDSEFNLIKLKPDIYTGWDINQNKALQLFRQILNDYESKKSSMLHIKSLLYELLFMLFYSDTYSDNDYLLIKPAIAYITKNYNKNEPISAYAKQCQLSESYFRKKFTQQMGISPIGYRNKIRFQQAIELYGRNKTLDEISEIIGFGNASYFLRCYKKQTGKSFKKSLSISKQ